MTQRLPSPACVKPKICGRTCPHKPFLSSFIITKLWQPRHQRCFARWRPWRREGCHGASLWTARVGLCISQGMRSALLSIRADVFTLPWGGLEASEHSQKPTMPPAGSDCSKAIGYPLPACLFLLQPRRPWKPTVSEAQDIFCNRELSVLVFIGSTCWQTIILGLDQV